MQLINCFINELKMEAEFQAAALAKEGYKPSFDDVFSEVCLAFSEAAVAYNRRGNHSAEFKTFFAGCVRLAMAVYRKKLRKNSKLILVPDIEEREMVGPDNGVGLIIEEIDQLLSKQESRVFRHMVHGGERPDVGGYYKVVARVRSIAKQVMEV